jgi:hypothetical protein
MTPTVSSFEQEINNPTNVQPTIFSFYFLHYFKIAIQADGYLYKLILFIFVLILKLQQHYLNFVS